MEVIETLVVPHPTAAYHILPPAIQTGFKKNEKKRRKKEGKNKTRGKRKEREQKKRRRKAPFFLFSGNSNFRQFVIPVSDSNF